MKKILTLALGLVLLISCSSDDSGSSIIDTTLLTNKNWYQISTKVLNQNFPFMDENPECGRDYSRFEVGGVLKDIYLNQDCEEVINLGTWILSGNVLATNEDGNLNTLIIKKLTATVLEVTIQVDYNEDGQEETATVLFSTNQ